MKLLLDHFPDDVLRDLGRIVILAGTVKHRLLSSINTLLSIHRGDQGIGSILLHNATFEKLCVSFEQIAVVRNVPRVMVNEIKAFHKNHGNLMRDAEKIATGMWTYMGGGASSKHFGLFVGEVLDGDNFRPDWRVFTPSEVASMVNGLISANSDVESFTGMRLIAVFQRA